MTDETGTSGPDRARRRTLLAAVGGGVAIALIAGGAIAVAASASANDNQTRATEDATAPSGAPNHHQDGQDGQDEHGPGDASHWGMRPGMGLGIALHGTFETAKPGGGYQTVAVQRGVVTAVSATSVTLKSDDSYSATYVIDANTRLGGDPKSATSTTPAWLVVGAKVNVVATVSGSMNTAVRIGHHADRDMGHMGMNPPAGAPQPGSGGPGGNGSPAPVPSSSSSTTS